MLNNLNFKSIFKNELIYFIKYKRSQGLSYENEVYRLKKIDDILCELKLRKKEINKTTFDNITKRDIDNNNYNYARQYGVTKDFCKYLISCGYENIYYKERKFRIINNYKPIVFNKQEIKVLFQTMDNYKYHQDKKYYMLNYTYSIFFRLIYACGLRISEAIKIVINDIDFDKNTIAIIDSKRHCSRLIVFSNSLKKCLEDYIKICNIKNGLLFKDMQGNVLNKSSLRTYYKKILKEANLDFTAHVHDLRHCFANDAFNQMLEKGYDENVVLIYLFIYMGHKAIRETEYYLHFTEYNKNRVLMLNKEFSKNLYEGVGYDEQ